MPPRSRDNTLKGDSNNYQEGSTEDGYLTQPLIPNPSLLPHWTVPVDGRPYFVIPARSSSDIPIQQSEVLIFLIFFSISRHIKQVYFNAQNHTRPLGPKRSRKESGETLLGAHGGTTRQR